METNKEFLQVWDYILDNEELDVTDVLLLSKVISLHATKDGCYISNDGVGKLLRLKNIETASRRIKRLEKMGYVQLKYIALPSNAKKTRRFIIPTYQNGLTQKSSRVDLKVNTPLTQESIPLDSKVNPPLILKSTPPCLESQSIISLYNINENINTLEHFENISPIRLSEFDRKHIKDKLYSMNLGSELLTAMINLIEPEGYLTKKQRELIEEEKYKFNKIGVLQPILNSF